jgi:hypothetical protein
MDDMSPLFFRELSVRCQGVILVPRVLVSKVKYVRSGC